jgi:predicted NUDIX family phosphoesterase
MDRPHDSKRLEIVGAINDETTEEGQKHTAVILEYYCATASEPLKGELSINDLRWLPACDRLNNLLEYEVWSQILLSEIFRKRGGSLRRE